MRSSGLLSVVSMQEERGDISFSQVFQLGKEQQDVLDAAASNSYKDFILKGKHLSFPGI